MIQEKPDAWLTPTGSCCVLIYKLIMSDGS
jgi:hypothetical protein